MEIKDLITDVELQECLKLVEDTVANHDGEDKETDLVLPEDIEIRCKLCGKKFIFTVGEQEFYASKNFPAPKRCRQCAKKRRLKFLKRKFDIKLRWGNKSLCQP